MGEKCSKSLILRNVKKKPISIMKIFTVIGWYRTDDEKDFVYKLITTEKVKYAVQLFLAQYPDINFYKIDIA